MSTQHSESTPPVNAFDNTRAIFASVVAAIIGWAVFMGMPILVGSLTDTKGFSPDQAGYVASADLGGMFLASIFVSTLIARLDRRRWILYGALISISANFVAAHIDTFEGMLAIRLTAGFGAGLCYTIALANLAATSDTARNFAYLIFAFVAVNSIELFTLPQIAEAWGVAGLFYAFTAVNVVCLGVYPFLPKGKSPGSSAASGRQSADDHPGESLRPEILTFLGWTCLAAVCLFSVMIGAFWAYIERLGVSVGFSNDYIAITLSATTVLSAAGAYFAYKVSRYKGQSKPLLFALLALGIVLMWLGLHPIAFTYFVGIGIYQLLWNGVDVYQLGTISNIDHSGRYPALVPAAQGLGQTIGPSAAAVLIGMGMGYEAVMYLCAAMAIATGCVYSVVYVVLKRNAPTIADAT